MKQKFIQTVMASQILTTRQKWIVIRHAKQNQLSDEEMQKLMDLFSQEQEFLEKAKQQTDEQHLKDLENWNAELERILHEEVPKKRQEVEGKEAQEDEEEAEKLLKKMD